VSRWDPGEVVADRFVIEGRLASGGMAEIYVARMKLARGVERTVAIKRIHPHLIDDPEFVTMFLDEARVSSQLTHGGVVPVMDAVEHHGDLLMILEYVPGWDLRAIIRRMQSQARHMPLPVALSVGRELAAILSYVHGARDKNGRPLTIVHRDVTPSNVLVATDGSVRLLDFGVAKAAARSTRTATATLKGKVLYAAPEQVLAQEVTLRTDLYALGLILFELATGRRALDAPDQLAAIEVARAAQHIAPSALRKVPEDFDSLVLGLLSKDPEGRPPSAHHVIVALDALSDGEIGVNRASVRAFVMGLMGKAARPLATQGPKLDGAFAKVLGLDAGGGTQKAGAATEISGPPEMTAAVDAGRAAPAGLDDSAAMPPNQKGKGRIMTALAVVLAVALGAGGVAIFSGGDSQPIDAAGAANVASGPRANAGFLRLGSSPVGAAVEVDGEAWDQATPTVVEVSAGEAHHLLFRLPDHHDVEADVEAVAGETTDVDVVLERVTGRLVVRSSPEGAEVTVAGEVRGVTPLELEDLPRDRVEVAVALEGHGRHREWAPLDEVASHEIDAELTARRSFGTLDVSSTPWARVKVAGRVVAESTPATGIRLPVGRHSVLLENPRLGIRARRSVEIQAGRPTRLVVDLR